MVVDGEASEEVETTSEVPHGSVLGPIFFLMYINDMTEYTKHCSVRLFTDDTIIYLTLTVANDCEKCQEDLQALERWEADWLMECHHDKYSVFRITRKKTIHRYPYTLHGQLLAGKNPLNISGCNCSQHDVEYPH